MRKRLYPVLLVLFTVVIISGCNDDDDNDQSSVKIGLIFPLSTSDNGKPRHHAALLAAQHLSQAGYTVKTAVGDSKSDPIVGVEAARRLVENWNAQVLIGAASSGVTIEIAEWISIPHKIPQISYSSTAVKITNLRDDDFLFRTAPPDKLQGRILAQLAQNQFGVLQNKFERVAILYGEDDYGEGLYRIFEEEFQNLGGTITLALPHQISSPRDFDEPRSFETELKLLANTLADTGEPQALIAISLSQDSDAYIKQAIEGGFFNQFIFVDGNRAKTIFDKNKKGEVNVQKEALEGMCGTSPIAPQNTESLNTFKKTYKDEFGESTATYLPNTYDAVILAGLAAYEAKSQGEGVTPRTIRDHLRNVAKSPGEKVTAGPTELKRALKLLDSGDEIDYVGASGEVDFDDNGDVETPYDVWCYEGGKIQTRTIVEP
jgi:ABC-type branched-subunit amino acid transport system substrate-binding protein